MAKTTDQPHNSRRKLIGVAVLVLVVIAVGIAWLLFKPREKPPAAFTGYVVSDNVYMSSPVSGTLLDVSVRRGSRVTAGQPLFRIDPTVRAADTDRAKAQISVSQAQVEQQQAALARAQADFAGAQTEAEQDRAELSRLSGAEHDKQGTVSALQLDQARASYKGATDKRDAAQTQVISAKAAIDVARAQVKQAEAGLSSAQRELSDLASAAPSAGRVDDVMYKTGESVPANASVVSIVPDGEVKVRFYVPQSVVSSYQPGRSVAIGCDGCAANMTATVDFVATRPEYTPPIIYSLDARQKLVFLVEAVPSDPRVLIPGQPMDVAATNADLPKR
jgi:HlyD family secretion protein